jgi:hypothetical protein
MPPLPSGLPVFVAMAKGESRPQRPGLVVTRPTAVVPAVECRGLPVDPVPEVLLACARHLQTVDLVVLIDSALQLERCSIEEIEEIASRRRRGAPRLRYALALADGRSESPYETLLRLLHVACGIEVEPQHVLRDQAGAFVARADLWLVGTHTLHEFDGDVHLTRRAQRKDLHRERRIGNETWVRRGYTASDVLHQGVSILRDADLSLGRPHEPEAIRVWHSWLARSMFTPSGRELLRHELGLVGTRGRVSPASGDQ